MQTKDHRILADYLWELTQGEAFLHRNAFLFGCVEPDYNYLSYFRGLTRQLLPRGHHADYTLHLLTKLLPAFI